MRNLFFVTLVAAVFFVPQEGISQKKAKKPRTTSSPKTSANSKAKTVAIGSNSVVDGLKEALQIGIKNAVNVTSVENGFLNNLAIRLPFPPDATAVKDAALKFGLDKQVAVFEENLNHAAEEATKEALPIFVSAVKNITIEDGISILKGGEGAATQFLKAQTKDQLITAFAPKVKEAISKVKLTDYWKPIISKYNSATSSLSFLGAKPINPDLEAYVTEKAIDGLFLIVEQEENKIRKDPAARVTNLLKNVFGNVLK